MSDFKDERNTEAYAHACRHAHESELCAWEKKHIETNAYYAHLDREEWKFFWAVFFGVLSVPAIGFFANWISQ